jgi:hypothetical protein
LAAKGQDTHVPQRLIAHLSAEAAQLRTDQAAYQGVLRHASQAVHPFRLADSGRQTSAQVEAALQEAVASLNTLRAPYTARDNQRQVAKVTRQLPALASLVAAWWLGVEHRLLALTCAGGTQDWLRERLLPTVYWQRQVEKTQPPILKAAYQTAFQEAHATLLQHPLTATLTVAEFETWQAWAVDLAAQFQRASSAVEGRNGYVSHLNHGTRGTPPQRLKVMTVIHNFDLKRADGTTAAQRLFGTPFPDLFDWVMEQIGALPMPRKPRTPSKPNLLNLQSVPP